MQSGFEFQTRKQRIRLFILKTVNSICISEDKPSPLAKLSFKAPSLSTGHANKGLVIIYSHNLPIPKRQMPQLRMVGTEGQGAPQRPSRRTEQKGRQPPQLQNCPSACTRHFQKRKRTISTITIFPEAMNPDSNRLMPQHRMNKLHTHQQHSQRAFKPEAPALQSGIKMGRKREPCGKKRDGNKGTGSPPDSPSVHTASCKRHGRHLFGKS